MLLFNISFYFYIYIKPTKSLNILKYLKKILEIEEYWFNQIKDRTDSDVSIILVGNKVDLFRVIKS